MTTFKPPDSDEFHAAAHIARVHCAEATPTHCLTKPRSGCAALSIFRIRARCALRSSLRCRRTTPAFWAPRKRWAQDSSPKTRGCVRRRPRSRYRLPTHSGGERALHRRGRRLPRRKPVSADQSPDQQHRKHHQPEQDRSVRRRMAVLAHPGAADDVDGRHVEPQARRHVAKGKSRDENVSGTGELDRRCVERAMHEVVRLDPRDSERRCVGLEPGHRFQW